MNLLDKKFRNLMFCINSALNSDRHVHFSCYAFKKRLPIRTVVIALPALLLIIVTGCATSQSLKAVEIQGIGDTTGPYALTLYHEAEYFGLKTIAFLVPEGNGYSLEPYAPDYSYTTIRNISGQDGLGLAIALFSKNRDYTKYEIRRISDPGGKTVGFEIRPLYDATVEGHSNVLSVEYGLSDGGVVKVHIHLSETSMEGSIR